MTFLYTGLAPQKALLGPVFAAQSGRRKKSCTRSSWGRFVRVAASGKKGQYDREEKRWDEFIDNGRRISNSVFSLSLAVSTTGDTSEFISIIHRRPQDSRKASDLVERLDDAANLLL